MRLIFQHIPRTGGTVFCTAARRWCQAKGLPCLTFPDKHAPADIEIPENCFIAAHNLTAEFPQLDGTWLTLLRDPIDRLISEWHYIRATPEHHLHAQSKATTWANFTLHHRADNITVRSILGEFDGRLPLESWKRAAERLQAWQWSAKPAELMCSLFGAASEWREPERHYPSGMQYRQVVNWVAQDINLWRALS